MHTTTRKREASNDEWKMNCQCMHFFDFLVVSFILKAIMDAAVAVLDGFLSVHRVVIPSHQNYLICFSAFSLNWLRLNFTICFASHSFSFTSFTSNSNFCTALIYSVENSVSSCEHFSYFSFGRTLFLTHTHTCTLYHLQTIEIKVFLQSMLDVVRRETTRPFQQQDQRKMHFIQDSEN